jgi:hypothetical protein
LLSLELELLFDSELDLESELDFESELDLESDDEDSLLVSDFVSDLPDSDEPGVEAEPDLRLSVT